MSYRKYESIDGMVQIQKIISHEAINPSAPGNIVIQWHILN